MACWAELMLAAMELKRMTGELLFSGSFSTACTHVLPLHYQ